MPVGAFMQLMDGDLTNYRRRHTNFDLFDLFNLFDQFDLVGQFGQTQFNDINKWKIKFAIILETDRNIKCPINLESIKLNDQYCRCSQCKHNFSKEALIEAFKTNHTCPMCRSKWNDKIVYVNGQI